MRHMVAYGMPALIALLAIPMVMGRVPPNGLYGFRTPKTRSSPEIWYPANRFAGWMLLAAAVVSGMVNLAIWSFSGWEQRTQLLWMANTTVVLVLAGAAISLIYLRRF